MHLDSYLIREIDIGTFPSASYVRGTLRGGIETCNALGHAVAVPFRIKATEDTIYDCASLTKPLITTTLILMAVSEGRISLDDEFRGHRYRHLLTHTTGLKAWLPLYALGGDYLASIEQHGRECAPGERVIYSDLNFIILHRAIGELYGDYVAAAQSRIFTPLGLRDMYFRPPSSLRPRIAATEWGQRFEAGMCAARGIAFDGFRQTLMWGETNDGNSHHAGGTAGNAGLFATARDVFRLTQSLARAELYAQDLVREATREHAPNRALGWQLGFPGPTPTSYGHTGFTGSSVWVDGDRLSVLLTNRIHPCAAPTGIQQVRVRVHGGG